MTSYSNLQGAPLTPFQDEWNNSELLLGQFYITFFVKYVRGSRNTVYLISHLISWSEENEKLFDLIALKTEFYLLYGGQG